MSEPRILVIETSGRTGSVLVASGPTILATRELSPTQRHAVELMPAVEALTAEQGWKPTDIDELYLSIGPGSFTGLRIAVAVARALHATTGCKLLGIPSLDVIAQNAPADFPIVIPLLDAKRTQVFAARYERTPEGLLQQTAPPALVDPNHFLTDALQRAEMLNASPNPTSPTSSFSLHPSSFKIALLGEGLTHFTPPPHPAVTSLPPTLWHATAANLHRLAYPLARQNHFSDPATLLPLYIRLPEAEEVYRKKHGLPT
jgi:tRNA threonylcarbamoyl adenosine modification protein YeaZ